MVPYCESTNIFSPLPVHMPSASSGCSQRNKETRRCWSRWLYYVTHYFELSSKRVKTLSGLTDIWCGHAGNCETLQHHTLVVPAVMYRSCAWHLLYQQKNCWSSHIWIAMQVLKEYFQLWGKFRLLQKKKKTAISQFRYFNMSSKVTMLFSTNSETKSTKCL